MNLVITKQSNKYELTYLLAGDLLDAEVAKVKKELADLIKKNKGKILEEADWGRKHLAYKIRQNGKAYNEAVYVHVVIEFPTEKVQKFSRALNLDHQFLRHLLVLAEEESKTPAKKESVSSEGETESK